MRPLLASILIVALWAIPALACAEERLAPDAQAAEQPDGSADFLFGRPHAWVAVSGTWLMPRASGDFFKFLSDQLTIERSDFRSPAFSAAVGAPIARRFDLVGDFERGHSLVQSQYRHYVKADRSEITQTTELNQTAIAVGLRYLPLGRGQSVSRFAFVPRRLVPYFGAGVDFSHYNFHQRGEFVDFVDLSIFNHVFNSNGWAMGSQVEAGADLQLWRMFYFNAGVRYGWVQGKLNSDFVGFDGIDLSGFTTSSGLVIVF